MSDYISRADAIEAVCRTRCGDKAKGCPAHSCLVIEEFDAIPSADAVDCTDFIEWLVDRVLDETIWEYNSVAYGEIICRKLEKLGILEVTEEPSYYIRPSADAVHGEWIFNPTDAIDLMFAKPKCSKCGFESSDGGNFCPNCGARMKGGAE